MINNTTEIQLLGYPVASPTRQTPIGVAAIGLAMLAPVVTETTVARTLSAADNGAIIYCTNAAGCTVTCTDTGPNALPVGFSCQLIQAAGAGAVTLAAAGTMAFLASAAVAAPYTTFDAGSSMGVATIKAAITAVFGNIA